MLVDRNARAAALLVAQGQPRYLLPSSVAGPAEQPRDGSGAGARRALTLLRLPLD
jgi:hypothetical protein